MQEKVKIIIGKYLKATDKVVVAVSGGVDSVVLLHLLSKSHKNLVVAHVNHGLRSQSDAEEQFVKSLAASHGFPVFTQKLKLKTKSEDEARNERYKFLRSVKEKTGAKYIATAHHLNDQAETVLLNLTRGTGPLDIWGMKTLENDIFRPLLPFSKEEIITYVKKRKLKYVSDKSNSDTTYSRNRIRKNVTPELEAINPAFLGAIRTEVALGQELSAAVEEMLNDVSQNNEIKLSKIRAYPRYFQKEIIKRLIWRMIGKESDVYAKNIEAVMSLIEKPGTKRTKIGAFTVEKNYDKILFNQAVLVVPKPLLIIPGKVQRFGAFKLESRFGVAVPAKNNVLIPAAIAYNISVRAPKPGDRIKTKAGTKKIQNLFVDAKINSRERAGWPVLECDGEIIWVPQLAAWAKTPRNNKEDLLIIEVRK